MNKPSSRRAALAFVGTAALALTVAAGGPASATTDSIEPDVYVEYPMQLVGYDRDVAAENGYEIRTTEDGGEYSVPIGTPLEHEPDPSTVVGGSSAARGEITDPSCGTSWLWINSDTAYRTGYDVRANVNWHKWGVSIESVDWEEDQNLDRPWPGPYSWEHFGSMDARHRGSGSAIVNPGSYAQLVDGGLCVSGGPGDGHVWS